MKKKSDKIKWFLVNNSLKIKITKQVNTFYSNSIYRTEVLVASYCMWTFDTNQTKIKVNLLSMNGEGEKEKDKKNKERERETKKP